MSGVLRNVRAARICGACAVTIASSAGRRQAIRNRATLDLSI
jgi:hypothetical protein